MREIRPYGSVRGVRRKPYPYRDHIQPVQSTVLFLSVATAPRWKPRTQQDLIQGIRSAAALRLVRLLLDAGASSSGKLSPTRGGPHTDPHSELLLAVVWGRGHCQSVRGLEKPPA